MLKKRFGITLIVLTTIIYGSIFIMGQYYSIGFFDEMIIQINRLSIGFYNKSEVNQSKLILTTIMVNEHPPSNWKDLIAHNPQNSNTELFYYYKIWSIKTKLSFKEVKNSYPIFKITKNNIISINMRYGKLKPAVKFPFFRDAGGNLLTGLFFPISGQPISADLNKDKKISYDDVVVARKTL
jgi:hypothetical protein